MRIVGPALILAVIAASCADDDGGGGASTGPDDAGSASSTSTDPSGNAEADTAEVGPFDVRSSVVTLTDPSRPTPSTAEADERPERELSTHLYEPAGDGPFPLIVFAHGLNGHPRKFTQLHTAWAEEGYVVAAPTFPVSNDEAAGGGDLIDLDEQPGDLGFVLDELLGPDSPLESPIDPDRIGACGLSLGGATVYGFVYDDGCRDDRVVAAMVLDGNELAFTPDLTRGPPLLLIHADPDPRLPYDNAVAHYAAATVPAGFLTLHETAHAEPYEDIADPADDLVEQVTIAWWDLWLQEDVDGGPSGEALERIDAAVADAAELATWESRLG